MTIFFITMIISSVLILLVSVSWLVASLIMGIKHDK
jgi:hypothetical protein